MTIRLKSVRYLASFPSAYVVGSIQVRPENGDMKRSLRRIIHKLLLSG